MAGMEEAVMAAAEMVMMVVETERVAAGMATGVVVMVVVVMAMAVMAAEMAEAVVEGVMVEEVKVAATVVAVMSGEVMGVALAMEV